MTGIPWLLLVAITLALACLPSASAPSPEVGFETGGAVETPLAPDGPWTRKMLALLDLSWESASGWSVDCEGAFADGAQGQSIPTSAVLRRLGDAVADEGFAAAIETACAIYDSRIAEMAGLGEPVSIDDVENLLEDLEACLDDLLAELETTDPGERRAELAALAAAVGMAEDVMDGLEYLASRIRLYVTDSIQSELARRVRDATLRAAEGDGNAFLDDMVGLLDRADELPGDALHPDAADAIRTRCDRLIRLCCQETASRSFEGDLAGSLWDIDLDAALAFDSVESLSPSRRRTASDMQLTADRVWDGVSIDVDVGRSAAEYGDRMRQSADTIKWAGTIGFDAERKTYALGVDAAVEVRRSPGSVDRQFASRDVNGARRAVADLAAAVRAAGLVLDIADELAAPLDRAIEAFDEGDLEQAVEEIEEFIDIIRDLTWAGDLAGDRASDLEEAAWSILPKRVEREWSLPVTLSIDLESAGTLDCELFAEARSVPTRPSLDWSGQGGAVLWSRESGGRLYEVALDLERTDYPNDLPKSVHETGISFLVERSVASMTFRAEADVQRWTYPHAPAKEKTSADGTLGIVWEAQDACVAFETDRSVVRYLNDPGRAATDTRQSELEIEWDVGSLSFEATATLAQRVDPSGAVLREQRKIGLSAAWESGDRLSFSAGLVWLQDIDWTTPTGDSRSLGLSVSFDWSS